MSRRSIENLNINLDLLDTSLWPTVLIENLLPDHRILFLNRKKAVDLFISTEMKVIDIETETGLRRDEIHRFVRRCLEEDELGEKMSYRALIPYKRVKGYNRKDFPDDKGADSINYTGAFGLLLDTYPTLKELIIDSYLIESLYWMNMEKDKDLSPTNFKLTNVNIKHWNMNTYEEEIKYLQEENAIWPENPTGLGKLREYKSNP